jgi:gliding motility-associated-like protein
MVVGLNGCWVDTVVSLKANAFAIPVPTINTLPKACINSKITLSGLGGDVYLWQGPSNFSSTSQQVSFTANNYNVSGIYTLSVKNNSNCVGSATALVNVYAQPKAILLSSKNNLCIPFCSEFKPNISGNVAPIVSQTFQINNQAFADSSLRYCFNQAGTFTIHLVVKDTNACTNVSSLLVNAYTKPEADFEFYPQNPLAGSEQVLFTNNSTGAAQSQWTWLFMKTKTDTIKTPQCEYLFKEPGKYPVALIVKNTWGCTDTIVKMIRVDEDFNLFVPNAFSPNGDGLNDTFQPKGTAIIQYQLSIYNRWGETLFSTSDFFAGWDGTFKGKDAKDDTYTWKIDIQNNFQIHKTYTGKVNLIR